MPKSVETDSPSPEARRSFLPLGLDVAGWRCVIVGGGRIGARKAETLLRAGARVIVVSPEASAEITSAAVRGELKWVGVRYDAAHLDGARLVVAATDDAELNLRIGRDAALRGVPCCVASSGRFSDVIFPAVHRAGGVTVAVHTDGRNCARSRGLRDRIAGMIEESARGVSRFTVLCARRGDAPERDLRVAAGEGAFVLSTCRRREAYALMVSSDAPRPGAGSDAFDVLTGPAAYHHLVRVAAGLDSPLSGEEDVAAQVGAALADQRRGLSPQLAGVVASALRSQAVVRAACGPTPERSWAGEVADRLAARLGGLTGKTIALLGCGRLTADIAERLATTGAQVRPFSHRETVPWCVRAGLELRPLRRLREDACDADAAVLSACLTDVEAADLNAALAAHAPVIDLNGANASHFVGRAAFVGLDSFADGAPSGRAAARIASAERAAYAETLTWSAATCSGPALSALRIGARRSRLSRAQAGEMRAFLSALWPEAGIEVVGLDAPGDRDKTTPLPAVTDDDYFTRDIDEAVRRGDVDAGLHSAKDLPRRLSPDLVVAVRTPTFAPWECLVTRDGAAFDGLRPGARIGISSPRRAQRLRELRPDLVIADIRGNVPDRIAQLDAGKYDGLILAAAGLLRLGLDDRIAHIFSTEEFPPEPAQGSLAIVVRADRTDLIAALAPMNLGGGRP